MLGIDLKARLAASYDLYGMDVRSFENAGENFFRADISDIKTVELPFFKIKPWLVIHAAAYTDVDGCEKDKEKADLINAQGTKNIAELCRQIKARLIYISTDYVFDGKKDKPYLEADKPNPISEYGRSKLKGEEFVRSILEEFLIVRTSWLFGKNGKNFVDTIAAKAAQEKVLRVVNDQRGSPTYTVDLSDALARLIEAVLTPLEKATDGVGGEYLGDNSGSKLPSSIIVKEPRPLTGFIAQMDKKKFGVYHVSNSGDCTWFEFAKKIVELKRLPAQVIPTDSAAINRPAKRPEMSILDKSKYRNLTGHILPDWQEALKKYFA